MLQSFMGRTITRIIIIVLCSQVNRMRRKCLPGSLRMGREAASAVVIQFGLLTFSPRKFLEIIQHVRGAVS